MQKEYEMWFMWKHTPTEPQENTQKQYMNVRWRQTGSDFIHTLCVVHFKHRELHQPRSVR